MDIWNDLGITNNDSKEHKCFGKANLFIKTESGIIKKLFPFHTVTTDLYQESSSVMNTDYVTVSKTIYTPFYWLPFTKGARVEFKNGEQLTIKAVKEHINSDKALSDGKGIKGLELIF